MLPRNELVLRAVCFGAAAVVVYQAGHLLLHANPLAKVRIPELPVLTNATEAASAPASGVVPQGKDSTNLAAKTSKASTNSPPGPTNTLSAGSNPPPVLAAGTNAAAFTNPAGSTLTAKAAATNLPTVEMENRGSNLLATGAASNRLANIGSTPREVAAVVGTNATNVVAGPPGGSSTNSPPADGSSNRPAAGIVSRGAGMPPGARFPGGMGGPGMQMAELPKETRAKLDRIIDSEILAPVMRPMPMALLGIAGQDVFLRGPNGQTGLVREGQSLGPVKVLKIGINRVLVEEAGETKELTIFDGMGSKSLLSTTKTNSP